MRIIPLSLAGAVATALLAGQSIPSAASEPVTVGIMVPQRAPVTVGVLSPRSGPYASIGEDIMRGLDLAFAEAGDAAAGRPIDILLKDTRMRAGTGAERARELLHDDVDFIVGIAESSVAYAVHEALRDSDVPIIVSVAVADGLTKQLARPNLFRTCCSASQSAHVLGHWLTQNGHRRAALIGLDRAMGYETTGGVARTFVEGGGKIVANEYVDIGEDLDPVLERIAAAEPDVIVSMLAGDEALRLVDALGRVDQANDILLADTGFTIGPATRPDLEVLRSPDSLVSACNYAPSIPSNANRSFVSAYIDAYGEKPAMFAESSYVAGRLVVMTIEALAGDLSDRAAIARTIAAMEMEAPRGPFRFDEFHNPVHNIYINQPKSVGDCWRAQILETYEDVSQFWHWTPEEFMAKSDYSDLARTWAPAQEEAGSIMTLTPPPVGKSSAGRPRFPRAARPDL